MPHFSLTANFLLPGNMDFLDRNFSRFFFSRNGEIIIICPKRGLDTLSIPRNFEFHIASSCMGPMGHSDPQGIFWKITSMGSKNRFLQSEVIMPGEPKFVFNAFNELSLTPTYRGFNVGNFVRDIIFRQFWSFFRTLFLPYHPNHWSYRSEIFTQNRHRGAI